MAISYERTAPMDLSGPAETHTTSDTSLFGVEPIYARRKPAGASNAKKLALIALPIAVIAIGGVLLMTSPNRNAQTGTTVAAAPPAAVLAPAPLATAPAETAAVAPPLTTTAPVVAQSAPAPRAAAPAAARQPARQAARRAAPAAVAPSAGDAASNVSATVINPPPVVVVTPPPVMVTPQPSVTPEPQTPPQ